MEPLPPNPALDPPRRYMKTLHRCLYAESLRWLTDSNVHRMFRLRKPYSIIMEHSLWKLWPVPYDSIISEKFWVDSCVALRNRMEVRSTWKSLSLPTSTPHSHPHLLLSTLDPIPLSLPSKPTMQHCVTLLFKPCLIGSCPQLVARVSVRMEPESITLPPQIISCISITAPSHLTLQIQQWKRNIQQKKANRLLIIV